MQKKIPKKGAPAADEIARAISLFFAARQAVRTRLAEGKKLDPSTWLRVETMKFIADHDRPKMRDVAAHLAITAPSATSLVQALMRKGLVAIVPDERDGRTSRLALTAKGKRELTQSLARGRKLLGALFNGVSAADLVTFSDVLEHIKTHAPR